MDFVIFYMFLSLFKTIVSLNQFCFMETKKYALC